LSRHVSEAITLLDGALRAGEPAPALSMAGIQELRRAGDGIVQRALRQLDRQLTDVVPREDVFRTFVRLEKVLQALEDLRPQPVHSVSPLLPDRRRFETRQCTGSTLRPDDRQNANTRLVRDTPSRENSCATAVSNACNRLM